jgi:hypothetical protein
LAWRTLQGELLIHHIVDASLAFRLIGGSIRIRRNHLAASGATLHRWCPARMPGGVQTVVRGHSHWL